MRIDLCKLRPGDVIFSREPTCVSRVLMAATCALYSHVMIVLYPDLWFETDGAGSGFKLIETVECFETTEGKYAIHAELSRMNVDVLRPVASVSPRKILDSIRPNIALRYPNIVQFIPLLFFLWPFPKFSTGLVRRLASKPEDAGGYCSQMVCMMLREIYGVSVGGPDDHISPGTLRRRLLKSGETTRVKCIAPTPAESWRDSPKLQSIYSNLIKVTSKLRAYQYPHRRESFTAALAETFNSEGIASNPNDYGIHVGSLRRILTNPEYFKLHECVWHKKYT